MAPTSSSSPTGNARGPRSPGITPAPALPGETLTEIRAAARGEPGLKLLILFGSRASGERVHPGSDWDFGYLADEDFDPGDLQYRLVLALETDEVDLVDLERASGLLRFRAAGDNRVLHEREPGVFDDFWFRAVSFWCDAAPILEAGYQKQLERLRSLG